MQGAYINESQRYSYFQKFIQYNPNKASEPNKLVVSNSNWHRTNFDAYLNYDKSIAEHNFKAMLGWHTERFKQYYDNGQRQNFATNDLTDMNAGDAATQKNGGYTR